MFKRKLLVLVFLAACVVSLAGCPTTYEKKMVGTFYMSKLTVTGGNGVKHDDLPVNDVFDNATIVLTKNRKFNMNIKGDPTYLNSQLARDVFKDILDGTSYTGYATVDELIDEIIRVLKEGFVTDGSFTNSNGTPVFTPSNTSFKLSDFGFNKITYNAADSKLFIHATKYGVMVFEFKKR